MEEEKKMSTRHLDEIERNVRENVLFIAKLFGLDVTNIIVNVQQLRGGYGRFAPMAWTVNKEERDELCINPEQFYICNPAECIDTILHELTHLYCHRNGIKECSRNGYYHNRRFREVAETVFKLKCIRASSGYNTTSKTNEEYLLGINKKLPHPFDGAWYRNQKLKKKGEDDETTSTHSFKYACPNCKQSVRGTKKNIRILCLDCRVPYKWIQKEKAKRTERSEEETLETESDSEG